MPSSAEALVAELEPVSLAEVNGRAALERRIDRKYIIDWDRVTTLVDILTPTHSVLEIDGRRTFGYATEYYDSATLGSYRAHVQRRRRRFKARVREYTDTGYRRIEVKLKGRRGETVKRWTDEPLELLQFARETIAREYNQEIAEIAPALTVSYRRITLVARQSPERVTIDYDLRFQRLGTGEAELLPRFAIVESKAAATRATADRVLRAVKGRPISVSKYVAGMALLSERVPNDLRPVVRRYFSAPARVPAA
jgi:hypothetical protein